MNWYKSLNPLSIFKHRPPAVKPVMRELPDNVFDYEKARQEILNSDVDESIKKLKLNRLERERMKERMRKWKKLPPK